MPGSKPGDAGSNPALNPKKIMQNKEDHTDQEAQSAEAEYPYSPEEWETFVKVLRIVSKDPQAAMDVDTMKGLIKRTYTKARKSQRNEERDKKRAHDRAIKEGTGRVRLDPDPEYIPPKEGLPEGSTLIRPNHCYICKQAYHDVHFFYHQLCPACAEVNHEKRMQSADLTGRYAILTGGRIKIGFEIALKLLRAGAHVVVTTRFPEDAAQRFFALSESLKWRSQLTIAGLDLRDLASVERFTRRMYTELPHLDILINNAAQTIKRPREFYQELLDAAGQPHLIPQSAKASLMEDFSVSPLLHNKALVASDTTSSLSQYFPEGQKDRFGQPEDLRPENSWSHQLNEINPLEMLEVQLVNNISPFMLNSGLKDLMLRSPHTRKFIVNVSAVEGQFYRPFKPTTHPHTNMAKAALNMMTRTSADDYARNGIYMNSVDTGWITEENPHPKKTRLRKEGFVPPLDIIDGAARVVAPVMEGLSKEEEPVFGKFLKDYQIAYW